MFVVKTKSFDNIDICLWKSCLGAAKKHSVTCSTMLWEGSSWWVVMLLKHRIIFIGGVEYRVPCTVYCIPYRKTVYPGRSLQCFLERPPCRFGSPMAAHVRMHTAGSCDTRPYTFVDPPLLRRAGTLTRLFSLSCYGMRKDRWCRSVMCYLTQGARTHPGNNLPLPLRG